MTETVNSDLRTLVRDLAKRRDSVDRRQLYFALIQAEVWTPVTPSSAVGHVQPGDLEPLDREALGGLASFAFFTHEAAASVWQAEEAGGRTLRLERISFVELLPLLLDAGAGSAYLNPAARYSGELYRHELETMLEGARTLARRSAASASVQSAAVDDDIAASAADLTLWERLTGWLK